MPYLKHPDLPHAPPVEVPDEDAAAVLRDSGWEDWAPPAPTPGIVPGTEDPAVEDQPEEKPRRPRKPHPADAEGDDV